MAGLESRFIQYLDRDRIEMLQLLRWTKTVLVTVVTHRPPPTYTIRLKSTIDRSQVPVLQPEDLEVGVSVTLRKVNKYRNSLNLLKDRI